MFGVMTTDAEGNCVRNEAREIQSTETVGIIFRFRKI